MPGQRDAAFGGRTPSGGRGEIATSPPLPIQGSVEVALPVERLWEVFLEVAGWPAWNSCFWRARVLGGELRHGATLVWAFNPIKPAYLYKMPASATVVEFERHDRVTWEVSAPGFHALHSYRFAAVDHERCLFGSWEVAEGRAYDATRRFWLAHFRYVCRESLDGAQRLSA